MTNQSPSELRQAWLEKATAELRPYFKIFNGHIPAKTRVSIGWPKGRKAIGECYHSIASSDEHREVFVSPAIGDGSEILAILAHELCHAALPDGTGHKGPFKRLAYAIGLEGKATATTAGPTFKAWSDGFIERHGDYPAGSINATSIKKQKTYLLKMECFECGFTARVTAKWIEEIGAPYCACNNQQLEIAG